MNKWCLYNMGSEEIVVVAPHAGRDVRASLRRQRCQTFHSSDVVEAVLSRQDSPEYCNQLRILVRVLSYLSSSEAGLGVRETLILTILV